MKTFIAKHLVLVVIGAVAVVSIVGAVWYISSSHAPSFNTAAATRGNVVESLDEAGTVLAENNVNLSFQENGQIAHVYVAEGQAVSEGTALADLSSASLEANLEQANAALAAAQANLAQIASGTRPEQLAIDQSAVTNAQSALSVDVSNAYTAADDAIHNQTDNLFDQPKSNSPIFLVSIADSQQLNNIESSRTTIEGVLASWYATLNGANANLSVEAGAANSALSQIKAYLDALALAVNDATPNGAVTATVLAGYKVNIVTARTEVGAALNTLITAESTLTTAQNTLTLAQAGATPQALQAQQAVVAQAQAGAAAAQVALNNASLVAPFDGTVQNLTAQIGQVVSPGVPVLSLVNNAGLKIQAYVSETDVAKIKAGGVAVVTLDAFGTMMPFSATVTTIDSAKTQVNGTASYLVTLHFTSAEPQVKDGMTGNIHMILAEDDNVVEVPSRLVINDNNTYSVLVATATGTAEKPVTIGLVGDNGMTEIVSGINEGDQLANY